MGNTTRAKFHLIITTDYELFGNGSGCIDKCLIAPTEKCKAIVESYGAQLTLFVETLEFACFRKHWQAIAEKHYPSVEDQLTQLAGSGHHLELHIHPQWLNAGRKSSKWDLDFDKWRIGNLSSQELSECMKAGLSYLNLFTQLTQRPPIAFRAGGWTIQPSKKVLTELSKSNIKIDSTVAPGIYNTAKGDWYEFRHVPDLPFWRVSDDICEESIDGKIIEVPIATANIGIKSHLKVIRATKSQPQFPDSCSGSYAGPNNTWQTFRGKFSKLTNMGTAMLDFSTLPAWALIEVTQRYMEKFEQHTGPIPIVAIGHNKNFSLYSEENLSEYLDWANRCPDLIFSDYRQWLAA